MNKNLKPTLVIAIIVNLIDVILHVATDKVEILRISGNILIIICCLALIVIPVLRKPLIALSAGLISFVLNAVFISQNGIGAAGILFIAVTSILMLINTSLLSSK